MLYLDADISNGMILQRDVPDPVTGGAEPRSEIRVRLLADGSEICSARAVCDEEGRFRALLPAVPGGLDSYTLEVSAGDETLTVSDVLFGDVFHITGQSNMELPISRIYDPLDSSKPFSGDVRTPDCPYIREFRVPIVCCFDPETENDRWDGGEWTASSSPRAADMSAVGYFFARKLFDRFGIPVGLVNTSAGGAPIEGFLPASELRAMGGYDEYLDRVTAPGWMHNTERSDAKRCGAYYAMLDREDVLASRVLSGDCPDGKNVDLPWKITGFSGRVWLWTEISLPDDAPAGDAMLILGTLTDSDRAYINGVQVGETGYMYPPRYYPVEEGILHPGTNRIAVRLDIFGNKGGFTPGKRWCLKLSDGSLTDLSRGWHYAVSVTADSLVPPAFFQGMPLAVYGITFAPAYRRNFKALVVYQGESNAGEAYRYRKLFTRFVTYYRERCGCDIPVIFTQLPEYGKVEDWDAIRQAQQECLSLPGTAMAVTLGLGELNDLHPINKAGVGERLAECAFKLIYNG